MMLAVATAGMAKSTITAVINSAHTKSGRRLQVIPGARILRTVITISSAATRAEISVNVTIWAQTSMRLPPANCGPERGVYEVQPASGPEFIAKKTYKNAPRTETPSTPWH